MLPNTAAAAVLVDEPCPRLGLVWACCGPSTVQHMARRMGTAKQQGGSRHCYGQDPLSRASRAASNERPDTPRGMLRFFVHPCLQAAAGEIGRLHRQQRITGISVHARGGKTRKRGEPGVSQGERANGNRKELPQLVRRALKTAAMARCHWDAAATIVVLHRICTAGAIPTAVDELCSFRG